MDYKNRILGHDEVEASQLLANPFNHRVHSQLQQDQMKEVLETVGWIDEVIVNQRTGHIVDGHMRVTLALRDEATVPVKYVDLTPEEEKLVLATYDWLTTQAAVDKDLLADIVMDLDIDGIVEDLVADVGIELEGDRAGEDTEPEVDKAAELVEKWGVEGGQLWTLGDHRLIVGDCTEEDVYLRLMEGESAAIVVTDPPYGVDYANIIKGRGGQKKGGWSDIENDALDDQAMLDLLTAALHGADAKVGFVWHPPGPRRWIFKEALEKNGWRIAQEIVWVKNQMVFGRADYQWRHEPCMYVKREGAPRQDNRKATTVWEVPKPSGGDHPTGKPVELYEIPLRNHTSPGDILYEPFAGSGTGIIAAENLGRRCYAVEIAPKYAAVCLERWAEHTGREPVLVE